MPWAPRKRVRFKATLVCGPPCSGKNTYVQEHYSAGDLIIDTDAIHQSLAWGESHEHHESLLPFAFAARDAIVQAVRSSDRFSGHVWVISTAPREADREKWRRLLGVEIVLLDTERSVCIERAKAERPRRWIRYVENWFRDYEPTCMDVH